MDTQTARLNFLKVAFRDYKVGAWSPSSKYLVKRVLRYVPRDLSLVMEFGPGGGVMTQALLSHLAPQGKLIVVEPNPDFVAMLSKIPDTRVRVVRGTAESFMKDYRAHGGAQADVMLSSIPFSFLKPRERESFVVAAQTHLRTGGMFIVFHQYVPLAKKVLEKVFGKTVVAYEWRNFLPCFVFIARK